ncbi:MAG: GNAT family N-acetyltransferase [Asgard group archaeon]|nr:GNAT family N-acetyltransferase [Asgard group archaeon]
MKKDQTTLYKLKRRDLKKAAKVLADAFYSDPLTQYMFPDDETRKEQSAHYFNFTVSYGLKFGEIYAPSPEIEGLAIWYLSDKYVMNMFKQLRAGGMKLYLKLKKDNISRMMPIGRFSSEMHNKYGNFKHWYLSPIGVAPEHQGKGFGSLLLRTMLNRIDIEKLPSLLETQNPTNVEIYKRFGYEVVTKEKIPNTEIPHWVMIRHPK